MHLLLVISSLGCGGAERVITRLAEAWVASGVQVTLATFDRPEGDFCPLVPGIHRRSMPEERQRAKQYIPGPMARCQWLRAVMRESSPQAIISFVDRTNVVTLLASRGLKIPVLVSERTDPEMYSPGRIWELLRRVLYPSAAAIVVQTQKVRQWSERLFPRTRSRVIPNPVPVGLPSVSGATISKILAVGRLGSEKGFDVLIQAFAQIAERHPTWQLRILGDGPLRTPLEQQIEALGLTGRVELPGRCRDVLEQLSEAGMFVLSSRFEGFPNALVEAMACGRAVISTNCPSGPSDLIETGRNGVLVPVDDAQALAVNMEQLLVDPRARTRLGQAASEIRDQLSMTRVLQLWNDTLTQCGCSMPERLNIAAPESRAA